MYFYIFPYMFKKEILLFFHNSWQRGPNNTILLRVPIWPAPALLGSVQTICSVSKTPAGMRLLNSSRNKNSFQNVLTYCRYIGKTSDDPM